MKHRFTCAPVICVLLKKNNSLFLLHRPEENIYSPIGGHVDGSETIRAAAAREAYEEAGVVIAIDDLKFLHVEHRKKESGEEIIWFFFLAKKWANEPYNKEPHKHSSAGWFSLDALPQTLRPTIIHDLLASSGIFYSEYGW